MITTDFVTGSPCWIDLGVPDVGAATGFYGAVFDWEFRSAGPEAGGYGVFRRDGRVVAAAGPLTEEGARPAWTVYFLTPDADAAAQAVERDGGAVRVPPSDMGGEGRMAQLTDPLGGEFALWQPGAREPGLESVDAPGALCWVELYTTDGAAAREFYRGLLGWETQDMEMPGGGGTYILIGPAGKGEERMHGGIMELPAEHLQQTGGRPYWHPVFAVEDCDATVAKVTENGGTVQMGPETAEGVGRMAVCADPFGADFVVLTPSPSGN
ncbi:MULTISPECIES: VOC family protein [Streptomyces]|uniref:VOC family protein n=1 Tax=Streptomyces TaxID=1883 RepID=UPI001D14715C|nr:MULTISPECIES: VOC family protein [Streptomyces]MCC3655645.1 VOC family protein [Streptomyces sp. S07_1.15]WSQ70042.1 VOC family protein [Streptomyces xinghaiensis]